MSESCDNRIPIGTPETEQTSADTEVQLQAILETADMLAEREAEIDLPTSRPVTPAYLTTGGLSRRLALTGHRPNGN